MTTNKERDYYWVRYTCINCQDTLDLKVVFGTSIPIFMDAERFNELGEMFKKYHLPAPECHNCGCSNWSYGKAVK